MKIVVLFLFLSSILFLNAKEFEYFIQVGSTKKKDNLSTFIDISNQNNIKYYIKTKEIKGHIYYRFLVGPFTTKDEAKRRLNNLKVVFKNKSSYISRFRKKTIKINNIKNLGYEAYLNRDFKSMNRYLEEAATLGDEDSIYFIGKNYHYGIGISQDISKAIYWYEKCQNDKRCLLGLGNIYIDYTLNMKPDLQKAFSYFKKASNKGSKKAKLLLENEESIKNIHKLLQIEKINQKLVETLSYQNMKNVKIQNLQIINSYKQDKATNVNITLLINGKLKDAFMRVDKNINNYWEVLEFKVY